MYPGAKDILFATTHLLQVRSFSSCLEFFSPVCGCPCASDENVANLDQTIQALRNAAQKKEDSLNEIINFLRAQISKSSAFVVTFIYLSVISFTVVHVCQMKQL